MIVPCAATGARICVCGAAGGWSARSGRLSLTGARPLTGAIAGRRAAWGGSPPPAGGGGAWRMAGAMHGDGRHTRGTCRAAALGAGDSRWSRARAAVLGRWGAAVACSRWRCGCGLQPGTAGDGRRWASEGGQLLTVIGWWRFGRVGRLMVEFRPRAGVSRAFLRRSSPRSSSSSSSSSSWARSSRTAPRSAS